MGEKEAEDKYGKESLKRLERQRAKRRHKQMVKVWCEEKENNKEEGAECEK